MNEATQTIEGWYALHDFRKIDWHAWRLASLSQRELVHHLLQQFEEKWELLESNKQASTIVYQIIGHKADIVFIYLRESLEQLRECQTEMDKSSSGTFLKSVYSYVSVVELSNYMIKPGQDLHADEEIKNRIYPMMPRTPYMCFYPMNKRREGGENWYMLSSENRKTMMRSHGLIGRSYAGKVKQIITGSIGFDNFEWGVTLFANDAIHIKKLIYEMRFDEVSARYAQFGEFFIGHLLSMSSFAKVLHMES